MWARPAMPAGPTAQTTAGGTHVGYLIGADIGSQSVKALLLDPGGREVASAGQAAVMSHPASGWAEQDPTQWRDGLAAAVRQALASAGKTSAGPVPAESPSVLRLPKSVALVVSASRAPSWPWTRAVTSRARIRWA